MQRLGTTANSGKDMGSLADLAPEQRLLGVMLCRGVKSNLLTAAKQHQFSAVLPGKLCPRHT